MQGRDKLLAVLLAGVILPGWWTIGASNAAAPVVASPSVSQVLGHAAERNLLRLAAEKAIKEKTEKEKADKLAKDKAAKEKTPKEKATIQPKTTGPALRPIEPPPRPAQDAAKKENAAKNVRDLTGTALRPIEPPPRPAQDAMKKETAAKNERDVGVMSTGPALRSVDPPPRPSQETPSSAKLAGPTLTTAPRPDLIKEPPTSKTQPGKTTTSVCEGLTIAQRAQYPAVCK